MDDKNYPEGISRFKPPWEYEPEKETEDSSEEDSSMDFEEGLLEDNKNLL